MLGPSQLDPGRWCITGCCCVGALVGCPILMKGQPAGPCAAATGSSPAPQPDHGLCETWGDALARRCRAPGRDSVWAHALGDEGGHARRVRRQRATLPRPRHTQHAKQQIARQKGEVTPRGAQRRGNGGSWRLGVWELRLSGGTPPPPPSLAPRGAARAAAAAHTHKDTNSAAVLGRPRRAIAAPGRPRIPPYLAILLLERRHGGPRGRGRLRGARRHTDAARAP